MGPNRVQLRNGYRWRRGCAFSRGDHRGRRLQRLDNNTNSLQPKCDSGRHPERQENTRRLNLLMMFSILAALMIGCSCASGRSSTNAVGAPPTPVVTSPTPDSVTQTYVALVHSYWLKYKAAEASEDGSRPAQFVCFGGPGSAYPQDIDPPKCQERAVAILAVHQKFLSDLDSTPPPPRFAADDRAFRDQLPKAITDVKAMISAAETGSKDAVLQATQVYVDDMIPTVTDALDDVDPSVLHD